MRILSDLGFLFFKPHKNFDFEVFSIYELNTPQYYRTCM